MAESTDILLKFILDKQATGATIDDIEKIEKSLDNLSDAEFVDLIKQFEQLEKQAMIVQKRYQQLENQIASFNKIAQEAGKAARVSQQVLGVGVGVVGGIFAAANKYAKDAEIATRETKAWNAEMALISRNTDRIGRTLVSEALPMLTQAARVTGQIASFIERNPELVKAAIGFGSAAVAVGAIGTATFRAIEAFAKVGSLLSTAQLTAAKLMNTAADKQLAAAGQMSVGGIASNLGAGAKAGASALAGGSAAGGAGLAGTIGFGATIAGFVALGVALAALVNQLANHISKITGLSDKIQEAQKKAFEQGEASGRRAYPGINQFAKDAEKTDKAAQKASQNVGDLNDNLKELGGVQGTGISQEVLDSFITFRETAMQLEEDYQKDRLKLIKNYNDAVSDAVRSNQTAISRINTDYQKTVSNILTDARKADIKAEQDYNRQRAEIVRDAGQDIKRIEEDLQDELRKMALDHSDRLAELTAERDALGIAKENRRYERQREEAQNEAQQEIARRRQDLAQRLADLRQNYEYEKQQRQQQLQERLAEAALEHEERLKLQAEANKERLAQLREAHIEQLRELDMQHRTELAHNREAFIARIRDLDSALLGEQALRRQYYQAMLIDAQNFFAQYRKSMTGSSTTTSTSSIHGTTGKVPTRQMGGYVPGGLTNLHAGEYVMSANTTRAMEGLIGGRLSEGALQSMSMGRGISNITLQFPGGYMSRKEMTGLVADSEVQLLQLMKRVFTT